MNLLLPKNRVLYHFTAGRFVSRIKAEGLTKGALPWHRCSETGEPLMIRNWAERQLNGRGIAKMRICDRELERLANPTGLLIQHNPIAIKQWRKLFPGFQWLTSSADWNQPFALLGELPYAKNANRITVCVPDSERAGLYRWRDVCEAQKPPAAEELNTPAVDWENWFIFNDHITPDRFLEIARNPGETVAAAFAEGQG